MKLPLTLLFAPVLHLVTVFSPAADRPNLLFIIVYDQSPFDLKPYDPYSKLEAPHIELLAAGGMTFEGTYGLVPPVDVVPEKMRKKD